MDLSLQRDAGKQAPLHRARFRTCSCTVAFTSYMIGIHDKRTKTTVLRPAPLHVLVRQVKKLKNLEPIQVSSEERMEQRNNLGEAFGTKKAKAAIRARERNRVDIDAMKDVAAHLQDTIMHNTDSLPTAGASYDSLCAWIMRVQTASALQRKPRRRQIALDSSRHITRMLNGRRTSMLSTTSSPKPNSMLFPSVLSRALRPTKNVLPSSLLIGQTG